MAGTIEDLIGPDRMVGIPTTIPQNAVVYPSDTPPALYSPTVEPEPEDTRTLGGIPQDYLPYPTSLGDWWKRSLLTPTVSPIGLFKAPAKTILKFGGLGIGAIGGFIAATVLGGGQEQQQDITQTPDVDPTQITDINPMMELLNKILTSVRTVTPISDTSTDISDTIIEGDLAIASPTSISHVTTITETYSPQITETHTTMITETTTTAAQEATQEQSPSWLMLAAIGIGAYFLMGRKKK